MEVMEQQAEIVARISSIEQIRDVNFPLVCRACLMSSSGDLLMYSMSQEVLEKYPIELSLDDVNLPWQICSTCYSKCLNWYEFKLMCIENEQHWQSSVEYVKERSGSDLLPIEMHSEFEEEEQQQQPVIDGDPIIIEETFNSDGEFEFDLDENSQDSQANIDWKDLELNVDVTCPLCPRSAKWSILFNKHLQDHLSSALIEIPGGQIGCPKCQEGCLSQEALLRHIYGHLNCTFGCPKCEAAFVFPDDLLDHAREECFKVSYEIILDDLGCKVCHTTFVSTSELKAHMQNHFGATETTTTTTKRTTVECDFCGKVFKQSSYLERHRVRHTSDRPHKCHLCDQAFVYEKELTTHVQSHDEANHKFVCPVCGPAKRYFLKRSLKAHIERNHKKRVRRFGCDVCEKRFFDATSLKKHSNTHTGLKPFDCSECGQSFARPDHMKEHVKRHRQRKGAKSKEPE